MAKKNVNEIKDGDLKSNIVVLRSVWGKRGQKYYIQPQKDSKGQYPPCVRKVNSEGDMCKNLHTISNSYKLSLSHSAVIGCMLIHP